MKTEKTRVAGGRRRNLFKTSHTLGGRYNVMSRGDKWRVCLYYSTDEQNNIDIWSNRRRNEDRCWDTEEPKDPSECE